VSGSDPAALLDMKRFARTWKAHRSMEAIRDRDDAIRERLCAQDRAGRPMGERAISQGHGTTALKAGARFSDPMDRTVERPKDWQAGWKNVFDFAVAPSRMRG